MLKEFAYLGEDRAYEVVITNPNKIADMLDPIRPIPRENYPPKIEGSAEELETMCREKAKRMYGDPLPEIVRARLRGRLKSIIGNGYDVMYMIAQKLVGREFASGRLSGRLAWIGRLIARRFYVRYHRGKLARTALCVPGVADLRAARE